MAMSEETQAIINTLRAEGRLVRNTGANSIKSVKLDLGKFQDLFKTMNENIQILGTNIANEELVEEIKRQNLLSQLSEDERAKLERDAAEREKRENELKNKDLALREKEMAERSKSEGRSLFGRDGIFSSIFSGTFGLIKKALFIGIGGSILYELGAGFLERFTGIKLPTIADGFAKLSEFTKSVNWEGLTENLKTLAGSDFAKLLTAGAIGYGAFKTLSVIGDGIQTVAILEILRRMMTPDAGDVRAAGARASSVAGRTALSAVRLGIAGLVFTGLVAVMPTFENLFRKYALDMSEDEIANTRFDATDVGGNVAIGVAGALTLKRFFALGGPKAWAVGATIFAFKTVYDYLQAQRDDDIVPNAVKDLEKARIRGDKKIERLMAMRARMVELGADYSDIDKQIAELEQEERERETAGLSKGAEKVLEEINRFRHMTRAGAPQFEDTPTSRIGDPDLDRDRIGSDGRVILTEEERVRLFDRRMQLYNEIMDNLNRAQSQLDTIVSRAESSGIALADIGLGRLEPSRIPLDDGPVVSAAEARRQATDAFRSNLFNSSQLEEAVFGPLSDIIRPATRDDIDRVESASTGVNFFNINNNRAGDTIVSAPSSTSTSSTNNLTAFGGGNDNQWTAWGNA